MENLAEMVKNEDVKIEENENLEIVNPKKEEDIEAENVNENIEIEPENIIKLVPFNSWFQKNSSTFNNIHQVRVSSLGIDPNKIIVVKILDPKGGEDEKGNPKQKLQIFEDVDVVKVLDLDALNMKVFNNGYQINYNYTDEIFIKSYGVKTGLIVIFCNNINEKLIPYEIVTLKRDAEILKECSNNSEDIIKTLEENVNLESVQLLYKQIEKFTEDMTTKNDVVEWLVNRQNEITDINHLLQIDKVIMKILS